MSFILPTPHSPLPSFPWGRLGSDKTPAVSAECRPPEEQISKWFFFLPLAGPKGISHTVYCEDLVELLEVKFTKVCGPPSNWDV
jgi:hypothetical protein